MRQLEIGDQLYYKHAYYILTLNRGNRSYKTPFFSSSGASTPNFLQQPKSFGNTHNLHHHCYHHHQHYHQPHYNHYHHGFFSPLWCQICFSSFGIKKIHPNNHRHHHHHRHHYHHCLYPALPKVQINSKSSFLIKSYIIAVLIFFSRRIWNNIGKFYFLSFLWANLKLKNIKMG